MRASTILLTASFLLAALAAPAQAAPSLPPVPVAPLHDDCPGFHTDGNIVIVQHPDCTYSVGVGTALCPVGESSVGREVGGHTVAVAVCDAGLVGPLTPTCGPAHADGIVSVYLHPDCHVSVDVRDEALDPVRDLVGALAPRAAASAAPECPAFHADTVLGGVGVSKDCSVHQPLAPSCPYLHVDTVFGPFFLYEDCIVGFRPLSSTTTTAAPTCPSKTYDNGDQRVSVQSDCDVYVKAFECIAGGVYDERAQVGPVTLYVFRCTFGPPPAPQAHDPSVNVDLPKTYDCVWGGSWVTAYTVGPVHVREFRCTEPTS